MARAKKKKRNGFLGLLQQSISGGKKLAKYAASGQWANDISRAVHRGGAGSRAKKTAQSRPDNYVPDYSPRDRVEASYQLFGDASKAKSLTDAQLKQAFDEIRNGVKVKKKPTKPKARASAAVKKAIAKVPTETTVIAHERTGTKNGVKSHKKKVAKADHQASVAAELLKNRGANQ